jgi:hypothetical protein
LNQTSHGPVLVRPPPQSSTVENKEHPDGRFRLHCVAPVGSDKRRRAFHVTLQDLIIPSSSTAPQPCVCADVYRQSPGRPRHAMEYAGSADWHAQQKKISESLDHCTSRGSAPQAPATCRPGCGEGYPPPTLVAQVVCCTLSEAVAGKTRGC